MPEHTPLSWRRVLAEVFADAEAKGLGEMHIGFTAREGVQDQAADFIGARCRFLADLRLDGDDD